METRLHILDVGESKYGDCLVVEADGKRMLIDGAHPGDHRSGARLPEQFKEIFGKPGPFHFDLLVCTHVHNDHIGCLPEMVKEGIITASHALLADPDLGYGVLRDGMDTDSSRELSALEALLREDFHYDSTTDEELKALADTAGTMRKRYEAMEKKLLEEGTAVKRYRSPEDGKVAEELFSSVNLRVLGPTKDHLEITTKAIARDLLVLRDAMAASPAKDTVDFLRDAETLFEADVERLGAAVNCQSIVMAFEANGLKALLLGDMQLAEPDVVGLEAEMNELEDKISRFGPYNFIKLSHHTAQNGQSAKILRRLSTDKAFYLHSGGRKSPAHPNPRVLAWMKKASQGLADPPFYFLRTDRNGRISIDLQKVDIECSKSDEIDFTANTGYSRRDDQTRLVSAPSPSEASAAPPAVPSAEGFVEVITKIPHTATKVTITIQVEPSTGGSPRPFDGPAPASGGRWLLTDPARLEARLGAREASRLLKDAETAGLQVVSAAQLEAHRGSASSAQSIVILGGHSVVPFRSAEVLTPDEKKTLAGRVVSQDVDEFLVWSDDLYAALPGELLPQAPVSRILDGGSAEVARRQLLEPRGSGGATKVAVRNVERPYADQVFLNSIPGSGELLVSIPEDSQTLTEDRLRADHHYWVLHGHWKDGAMLAGEDGNGLAVEAILVGSIPEVSGSVAFCGACWGALPVNLPARLVGSSAVEDRGVDESIVLKYLARGGTAFVGATGLHYSPVADSASIGGLHESFWKGIQSGKPPARALFEAKWESWKELQKFRGTEEVRAIWKKSIVQLACFGRGW